MTLAENFCKFHAQLQKLGDRGDFLMRRVVTLLHYSILLFMNQSGWQLEAVSKIYCLIYEIINVMFNTGCENLKGWKIHIPVDGFTQEYTWTSNCDHLS